MKIFLNILLVIISLSAYSQNSVIDNDTIHTDLFDVVYSEKLEQPLWIRYEVLCPLGEASRNGLDFRIVKNIKYF